MIQVAMLVGVTVVSTLVAWGGLQWFDSRRAMARLRGGDHFVHDGGYWRELNAIRSARRASLSSFLLLLLGHLMPRRIRTRWHEDIHEAMQDFPVKQHDRILLSYLAKVPAAIASGWLLSVRRPAAGASPGEGSDREQR
ncbi:hypothetical protein ACFWUU_05325 [Kribbella sp. NPDC058693]|uniref:hypothetical protein n=1 Tax=Kribbella sp. NPDC058693 TaxID=3346602 RepID=UPI0036500082